MKKILVPTDFSPNANKALDFAVQIARQANAQIILLHACNDIIDTAFQDNQSMYKEYNQGITKDANEQLLLLKKSIDDTETIPVKIHLFTGTVTDTILEASDILTVDLIIMGTLGSAGLKEKIFGSKTAHVIGKTNVPVMSVPLLSEWSNPGKILIAVNNFEEHPDLFNPVFELAQLFNATVEIAIFTDVDSTAASDYLKDERSLFAYEKKLTIRYCNVAIKATHLNGHTFQATIEEYIIAQGIDLVAMVTHKRTFMESIFYQSMTKNMSYHTRIPLLAIPAKQKLVSNEKLDNENKYSNQWV